MATCIFCRAHTSREPREHIIPEGLIGEPVMHVSAPIRGVIADRQLVLKNDEVCRRCNSDVAVLDRRLQDELGLMKVMLNRGVTKRGRPPRYERPGILAERRAGGPTIILNGENRPIETADGRLVQPVKNRDSSARVAKITRNGPIAKIQIEQSIPLSKKTFRALHKIAFEMLAFQFGPETVLSEYYDPIRSYVRRGKGTRALFVRTKVVDPTGTLIETPGVTIHPARDGRDWLVEVRLGLVFYIDMSPLNDLDLGSQEDLEREGLVRLSDDYRSPPKGS